MKESTNTPEHLGGHLNKVHLDLGTLDYLIKRFEPNTFLDIGCGPGWMTREAISRGLQGHGIDGDPTLTYEPYMHKLDFTTDEVADLDLLPQYDLGWSVEFVEHVEGKYIPVFMQAFSKCKAVCMTYSPDPRPPKHVNVQSAEYWINVFKDYGFILDEEATKALRTVSTMKKYFMSSTGMVFIKEQSNEEV